MRDMYSKILIGLITYTLVITASVAGEDPYYFKSFKVNSALLKRHDLMADREMERNDEEGVSRGLISDLKESDSDLKNVLKLHNAIPNTLRKLKSNNRLRSYSLTDVATDSIKEEINPIFAKVLGHLSPVYESIGSTTANGIISRNKKFNFGAENHSGFVWQKPMGNFSIGVNRQVAPDLFDDTRWVVSDTFTLNVDAYTFLHNLDEVGLIDITKKQLAAFAGLEFKRVYRYAHFANSFEEGLKKDFTKLFLTFVNFTGTNFLKMNNYEFMSKKDYLSFKAGGGVHIPVASGAAIGAGVLVGYNKVSSVEVQAIGALDNPEDGERFRISFEKEKGTSVESSLSLEAEFFQLLKLTLLSYEHSYSFSESEKMYLSLYEQDLDEVRERGPLQKQLQSIFMMNRPDMVLVSPYVVSRERRIKENSDSHFKILLFGNMKKRNSEQVTIEKDGVIRTFFRNRSESVKYVKGLFTSLINAFTRTFSDSELFPSYKSSRSRKLLMEYEGEEELTSKNNAFIDDEGKLSLNIDHQFSAKKTKGWYNKKYKKYAIHFANNFTNLPGDVVRKIDNRTLRGPIQISVTARINEDGLKSFNRLAESTISKHFKKVCKLDKASKMSWWKRLRYQSTSKFKSSNRCYRRLSKKYKRYISELKSKGDMSLWRLKDLLLTFNKHSDNKDDLRRLFGYHNVFYNGSLSASSDAGRFLTYFKDGKLQSMGVISDFQRTETQKNNRVPASIKAH